MTETTIFEFGPFRFESDSRALYFGEEPVQLEPKAILLLKVLLEASPALVTKDEIMKNVWSDVIVEEGNIYVQKAHLSAAFKKYLDMDYISVQKGVGLRFLGKVNRSIRETPQSYTNLAPAASAGDQFSGAPSLAGLCQRGN